MSDERFESYPAGQRDHLPWAELFRWIELFRTFRIALDPKKLIVAAAGILVMATGWWVLSVGFYNAWSQPIKEKGWVAPSVAQIQESEPGKSAEDYEQRRKEEQAKLNQDYDETLDRWVQFHFLAGSDYATVERSDGSKRKVWGGKLRTLPWFEDRGPNPYQLVTGQVERPWEKGQFFDWFVTQQVPVLIEPLVKFLEPVVYLLHPKTGTYTKTFLLAIILWTLATWALFGGVITRMAAVELAGKEPLGFKESFRFVWRRYASYLCAPLVPFALVAVLALIGSIFGLIQLIPFFGDLVNAVLWPVLILVGLGMALLLVGLVGYPLMYPTISAEGSDTLDALSRSYNYVYQSPWSFIWYGVVAIVYGAVVVFFVGFMGSLTAYLSQWGMSMTTRATWQARNPQYLFVHTPTSFGWQHLLLKGSPGEDLAAIREAESAMQRRGFEGTMVETITTKLGKEEAQKKHDNWMAGYYGYSKVGAWIVAVWITLLFLMVLGVGYSFFWTTSTMIYLLMRKKVDDTDLDEVYLEDEDTTDFYGGMAANTLPITTPPPAPNTPALVDLNIRSDKPDVPPEPPAPPPPEPPASPFG